MAKKMYQTQKKPLLYEEPSNITRREEATVCLNICLFIVRLNFHDDWQNHRSTTSLLIQEASQCIFNIRFE